MNGLQVRDSRDLEQFINISRYAGERFDLVQAGGGNSSLKCADGTMLIKASGCSLSEVDAAHGYTTVHLSKVLAILEDPEVISASDKKRQEAIAALRLQESLSSSENRPSIETYLHALLARCTLHTHPIAVNAVAGREDWESILGGLIPEALFVPYETPGLRLALLLKDAIARNSDESARKPMIVFLQNHGLIVSGDEPETVKSETERIVLALESYLGISLNAYKLTTTISTMLGEISAAHPIVYRSTDAELLRLVADLPWKKLARPFCPDGLVYTGAEPVMLDDPSSAQAVSQYYAAYGELPKVLMYRGQVFCVAPNVRKAKEIEEVFKFHAMVVAMAGVDIQPLAEAELAYLGNWEAEKYRQQR